MAISQSGFGKMVVESEAQVDEFSAFSAGCRGYYTAETLLPSVRAEIHIHMIGDQLRCYKRTEQVMMMMT